MKAMTNVWRPIGAALLLAGVSGCGHPDEMEITHSRVADKPYGRGEVGLDINALFGGKLRGPVTQQSRPVAPKFTYDLPAGWKALQPTQFRHVNLVLANGDPSQLTVTTLPPISTVRDNIDRWRNEMGLEAITDDDFESLEQRTVMGAPATVVDMTSDRYANMANDQFDEPRLMGAIGTVDDRALFIKMVVPSASGDDQRAVFDSFLASLRVADVQGPPISTDAEMPSGHPPVPGANGQGSSDASSETPAASERVSPLTWNAPDGWDVIPSTSQFREVTFKRDGVEMYISLARGDVGGNINRWAGQLKLDALDAAALAALPRLETLGTEAVIFEGAGSLQGMMDKTAAEGRRMIASVVPLKNAGGTIVTLKMTGADAAVLSAKPEFMDVLGSLGIRR